MLAKCILIPGTFVKSSMDDFITPCIPQKYFNNSIFLILPNPEIESSL